MWWLQNVEVVAFFRKKLLLLLLFCKSQGSHLFFLTVPYLRAIHYFFLNGSIIALQCGVNFCCPTTLLSLPPTPRPHSTPLGHHRAVLPVHHSSFPLAGYFTHCSGYMSVLLSPFVMLYFFNKHWYVLFDSHNRICNLNLLNIITTNPYEHTSPLIIIKLLITLKVFVLLTLVFLTAIIFCIPLL